MPKRNHLVEEQTGANGKKTELVRNLKKNGMEVNMSADGVVASSVFHRCSEVKDGYG